MCKSPKKLFKAAKKIATVAVPAAAGFLIGGPAGAAVGASVGLGLSQKTAKAQEQPEQVLQPAQPAQPAAAAPAVGTPEYLQAQTAESTKALWDKRRNRRGPGAALPSFLTPNANKGITTGGASLLGGGG